MLSQEKDNTIVEEVINFYEYIKDKQKRNAENEWEGIEEEAPTVKEVDLINNYINYKNQKKLMTLDKLIEDLGLN